MQFASTGSTVNEGDGTVNLTLEITDEDANPTSVDVVLITGAPGRVNSYTTQTVTFPANSGADETVSITVTDNGLCDGNTVIGFELQNITGGNSAAIGTNDTYDLTINDNDVCTNVSFATASATIGEAAGTYDVVVDITDFSASQATSVDVVLVSGDGARINGFTTQTVTFPVNSGTSQTVTLTVTDNASCSDGNEVLTFALENITGGQGTPTVGAARTLTINDNDAVVGEVIARQAFDGLGSDNWAITTGAGNVSTAAGGADTPANQRILSGTASWQVINGNQTLELAGMDVSGYSNIVLTARLSSTSSTAGNGAEVGDIVRFFVDVDGAGFPGTADITVTGFSNARWGYSTGTGVASTTAGTPASFAPVAGGDRTTDGYSFISISIPGSPSSVSLRATALNNAAEERWNIDDIQVTGNRCSTTFYSRASGDVGDAIWSDTPTGSAGSVDFSRFASMVVQTGDVVNVNEDTRVNTFTVETGAQVDLAANTLTVSGDAVSIDGTFTAVDDSEVLLNSADLVTFESAAALDLFDLTATTPDGVLTDATIAIRGTLQLNDGEFDASLGAITLSSTNSGTGRLGPVASGASYTGDLTVQRYIPAGATNWRLMGSPVAGQTVNEWKDDFYTAGFPGSHSPNFANPVESGILWPSVRWYNEALAFPAIDTGWVGVSSIAQSLAQGQGFAAWCGTGLDFTTAFTVDVTGAPYVASTPIDVALSYTDNSAPAVDGWNAVSNPLASPILFSNIARTNVEDYVWFYDPANGNTAVWDISLEEGTLGGSDTIQSSQAFLVKANAASAQLQFEETDKVARRTGGFFGGDQVNLFTGVRLKITSGLNTFNDEALVLFGAGTADLDGDDVPKMTFAHPAAPQIATLAPTDEKIAINAFGSYDTDITIPVMVDVAVTGTYTVTASNMENLGLTCLMLEDLQTGTLTPMTEGASYSFAINADDSADEPRLLLHASAPVPLYAESATCFGSDNGQATIVHVGDAPIDITWSSNGEAFLQQTIAAGVAVTGELAAGTYTVSVSSNAGCGVLENEFTIEQPAAMEAIAELSAATCPDTEDGRIDLTVLGGTAPFTYAWSNSSTTEDLDAAPGTYTVVVTDANECVLTTETFTIEAGEAPVATATADATTTLVDLPVNFENTSLEAESFEWNFGDGNTSTEVAPFHTWSVPGTYTVTLTVSNGECSSTWSMNVVVETSTSITDATNSTALNAWFANDKFLVEHGFDNGQPVVIDVLDATGRLHTTRQAAGIPARINVPAERLSTGIWFLRISNNGTQRTLRVPLVR